MEFVHLFQNLLLHGAALLISLTMFGIGCGGTAILLLEEIPERKAVRIPLIAFTMIGTLSCLIYPAYLVTKAISLLGE